jgi:hypothetical protein
MPLRLRLPLQLTMLVDRYSIPLVVGLRSVPPMLGACFDSVALMRIDYLNTCTIPGCGAHVTVS